MNDDSFLKGKRILAVDDETDVLEVITEQLHDIEVVTADNYSRAKALLESQKFDLVILDIMGVKGFELLKICGDRKLPAAMLTARASQRRRHKPIIEARRGFFLAKGRVGKPPIACL